MSAEYLYVLTALSHRFGVRIDVGSWAGESRHGRGFVVDDLDAGVQVAQASASCLPFLVDIVGERHIMFAGTADLEDQKYVAVDDHPFPVHEGVWMAFPEPFISGRVVTVAGLDDGERELFRLISPPLDADSLQPLFGPSWTIY